MAMARTRGTAKFGLQLAAVSLLALVCGVIIGCDALYEDQVGLWDWYVEFLPCLPLPASLRRLAGFAWV